MISTNVALGTTLYCAWDLLGWYNGLQRAFTKSHLSQSRTEGPLDLCWRDPQSSSTDWLRVSQQITSLQSIHILSPGGSSRRKALWCLWFILRSLQEKLGNVKYEHCDILKQAISNSASKEKTPPYLLFWFMRDLLLQFEMYCFVAK